MSFWARPALLFGSVPGITPEVVRERGGHVRPERETCDALERFAFSGQRQCFQSLAAITAGDEEVHAHIDSLALKRSDDRTTEFTDRDRDKPVAQRLPAHMFVFAARHQMERQPVDGPQNIPDQFTEGDDLAGASRALVLAAYGVAELWAGISHQ